MTCCKTSYTLCDPIPACIKQLIIKTSVISDDVTLRFLDKFGNIYYVPKTSDAGGLVTVQLIFVGTVIPALQADLPIGLLNQYAGEFKIMVYDKNNVEVKWTISGIQYDAIVINVKDIIPVTDTYTVDVTYAQGTKGQFNL